MKIINAEQWYPEMKDSIDGVERAPYENEWSIVTKTGRVILQPGDYIVTHQGGHKEVRRVNEGVQNGSN